MQPATSIAPLIIGRYALFEQIASGGMATVYLGRLLGSVGFSRTVAIKRLHAQFAQDPDFAAAFLDEARLAARVRHPNVVPTLDVVAMQGELFLVMEYVEGESLSQLLRASRKSRKIPPVPVIAGIASGMLHGLHGAHEARNEAGEPLGIVHRDVSPQNVLVGTDGVPRVLDFGVAKAEHQVHQTRSGELKGKVAYMAPEQLLGQPINRRADVFAAGILLWEALTTERLFAGQTEGETVKRVLELPVPPPRGFAPDVPAGLEAVVLKALERDPSKRFQNALDMAVAVEEAVNLATPRKIGEWVRDTAQDRLDQRASKVSLVESSAPSLPSEPTLAGYASPASGTVALPQPTPRRSSLPLILGLAGVGVIGAVAVGFFVMRRPAPVAPAAVSVTPTTPAIATAMVSATASATASATVSATAAGATTTGKKPAGTKPTGKPAPSGDIYSRD